MGIQNKCCFIGRLGSDAIIRNTGGATPVAVANFSIAVNERIGKKDTTTWVNVVAFNGLAEIVRKYTHKGSMVGVTGRMQNREWVGKDGAKKITTEIIINDLLLLDPKPTNAPRNDDIPPVPEEVPEDVAGGNGGDYDEDIPF